MSLGRELRSARLRADLTQEQLAASAGLDRAYVSLLENDHKSPTVDTLLRLCRALGTPASELLARVERGRRADEPATPPPAPPGRGGRGRRRKRADG
jgi:transcriptional regulator with XRE-family HTH domain